MNVPIIDRQTALLRKLVRNINVKEYIEFGCGEGHNLKTLSDMGLSGIGIDFSSKALEIARRKKLVNTKLLEKDFMQAEIDCLNTDLVVLLFVLEHIENDDKALEILNSRINNNGYLILSIPAHEILYSSQDKIVGHYRRYNRETIISKLEKYNFNVEIIQCFGFPVANLYTKLYNIYLSKIIKINTTNIFFQNTPISGIRLEKSHFPKIISNISNFFYPVISQIIKSDTLFLNYDLGTHYIILARKYCCLLYTSPSPRD